MNKREHVLYIWNALISGCILILVVSLSTLSLTQSCQASEMITEVYAEPLEIQCEDIIQPTAQTSTQLSVPVILTEHSDEVVSTADDTSDVYMSITEEELYLVSQILYLEARGETIECQEATVSVILNRMTNHNMTVEEVIFADNQFSTAPHIDKAHPSDEMIERVRKIFVNGPTLPEYVTYFRAGRYHEWDNAYGKVVRYDKIDNTYFSYDVKLKAKYDAQLGE